MNMAAKNFSQVSVVSDYIKIPSRQSQIRERLRRSGSVGVVGKGNAMSEHGGAVCGTEP